MKKIIANFKVVFVSAILILSLGAFNTAHAKKTAQQKLVEIYRCIGLGEQDIVLVFERINSKLFSRTFRRLDNNRIRQIVIIGLGRLEIETNLIEKYLNPTLQKIYPEPHIYRNVSREQLATAIYTCINSILSEALTIGFLEDIIYDKDGLDEDGLDRNGYQGQTTRGEYNIWGYNDEGFDRGGWNHDGFNRAGYDKDGYCIEEIEQRSPRFFE